MIELIESAYVRERYKEIGFQLTDFQKATLIWNKPNITRSFRLSLLADLAKNTKDNKLREQINERIAYEEKAMAQFETELYGEVVYVVSDRETGSAGYFGKYKTAFAYAQSRIKKEKSCYLIEKHKMINGDNIPLVKTSLRVSPYFFAKKPEEKVEYSGEPIACLYLDENADILDLWSNELDEREDDKVDEYRKERFENHFLELPYIYHEGDPVRYILTGEYGIIKTSNDEWDSILAKIRNGLYADFSDTAVTMYFLTENGYWSHTHLNPIYLEVDMPEMDIKNKKQIAFYKAMEAMGDYMYGHKNEFQERLVLETAQEYADICEELKLAKKRPKDPKHINDILC